MLENSEGGLGGSLLAAVDNCATPAGRRRLRQWLCRPLFRVAEIEARQDAVEVGGAGKRIFFLEKVWIGQWAGGGRAGAGWVWRGWVGHASCYIPHSGIGRAGCV